MPAAARVAAITSTRRSCQVFTPILGTGCDRAGIGLEEVRRTDCHGFSLARREERLAQPWKVKIAMRLSGVDAALSGLEEMVDDGVGQHVTDPRRPETPVPNGEPGPGQA